MPKISCLIGRYLASHSSWSQHGRNQLKCCSLCQEMQHVPESRGALGAGQTWVAGFCSPRVALATDISVGPDSLPALFIAVSHCIQVILDHSWALNGSSLSMSNLLGGAQNALTGKFDQHHVYKMPFASWCPLPLGVPQGWWLSLQLVCPMWDQAVPHHNPTGPELAFKCSMRADDGEAPGTLFLCLFINITLSHLRAKTLSKVPCPQSMF